MIAVLGSANMDLVTQVPHIPRPGETVLATGSQQFPGGKGANQAVAAARLGENVAFFGKVGQDPFGDELLRTLQADGIDVSDVERVAGISTGLATILVDEAAENAIACTPGANASVDEAYVDRVFDRLCSADVLLLQFEIPVSTIAYVLRRLPPDGPTIVLDPAPAQDLSSLPLQRIDVLTPNTTELIELTGTQDVAAAARQLLARGVHAVLCKAGDQGAYWFSEQTFHISAFPVAPVDTTAAGDAFNGALACVFHQLPIERAIQWASAVGALATTTHGAQPSLPLRSTVDAFLEQHGSLPGSRKGR